MWVRLKNIQRIEVQGKMITYNPGDWVDVGKQTAILWLANGEAEIPKYDDNLISEDAGIVIVNGASAEGYASRFRETGLPLVSAPSFTLSYHLNVLWNPSVQLRAELINVGLGLLDRWEIACPLYSYSELAIHMGSDKEREDTKRVIRDLRVPVYDTRLIFARRCENVVELLNQWDAERLDGDEKLAFMRAYYRVKPLMLALPITWINPRAYSETI